MVTAPVDLPFFLPAMTTGIVMSVPSVQTASEKETSDAECTFKFQ